MVVDPLVLLLFILSLLIVVNLDFRVLSSGRSFYCVFCLLLLSGGSIVRKRKRKSSFELAYYLAMWFSNGGKTVL